MKVLPVWFWRFYPLSSFPWCPLPLFIFRSLFLSIYLCLFLPPSLTLSLYLSSLYLSLSLSLTLPLFNFVFLSLSLSRVFLLSHTLRVTDSRQRLLLQGGGRGPSAVSVDSLPPYLRRVSTPRKKQKGRTNSSDTLSRKKPPLASKATEESIE